MPQFSLRSTRRPVCIPAVVQQIYIYIYIYICLWEIPGEVREKSGNLTRTEDSEEWPS